MPQNADKVESLRSLEELLAKCLSKPQADWPRELSVEVVEDVDSVLRAELPTRRSASKQLEAALSSMLAEAPAVVRAVLSGEAADPAVRIAFLLGQLTCAHRLVEPWWERKPSPTSREFLDEFDNEVHQTIIAAMRQGPQGRVQLVQATGLDFDVFNEHFGTLVKVGIVEFTSYQKEGTRSGIATEWFLSAAAEAIAKERNLGIASVPG